MRIGFPPSFKVAPTLSTKFVVSLLHDQLWPSKQLARLGSLAVYFDTDSPSIAGLPVEQAIEKFTSLVKFCLLIYVIMYSRTGNRSPQMIILQNINSFWSLLQARAEFVLSDCILAELFGLSSLKITLNKEVNNKTPKNDVQLLFDEIGFGLDEHQYRDVVFLVDMYQFYLRRYQVRNVFYILSFSPHWIVLVVSAIRSRPGSTERESSQGSDTICRQNHSQGNSREKSQIHVVLCQGSGRNSAFIYGTLDRKSVV